MRPAVPFTRGGAPAQRAWVVLAPLLVSLLLAPAADARRSKAAKKSASVRRTASMRAAAEAGQQLIDAMVGRRAVGRGGTAEQLLDAAVEAYTEAAADPASNQTEAWYQLGYLQKGFYQEQAKKRPGSHLRRHRAGAFSAYQYLVTEVNPDCVQGWEGLASVHDDMAAANEAEWADVVETYRTAVAKHPTWVRGARRAAEIVLTKHGVADTEGGRWSDTDALESLDTLIDLVAKEPDYFRRAGSSLGKARQPQWQHFNQQWIFRAASSMHAERGELARAVLIEGLSCSIECCPDGASPLNAAEILPHYNVPLAPMEPTTSDSAGELEDDLNDADVFVYEKALSDDVFEAVVHGFRLKSSYWGPRGVGYTGDFYSHWYSLKEQPTNSVHQAIQQLAMRIHPTERKLITGVEWWAHKRPFGDDTASLGSVEMRSYRRAYYQYHHFHFDLDDVVLDQTVSRNVMRYCAGTSFWTLGK